MNTINVAPPVTIDVNISVTFSAALVEQIVREIMYNCPECSQSLDCIGWKYEEMKFTFIDPEDGKKIILDKEKLLAAFPLLFDPKKYSEGYGPRPPLTAVYDDWNDWLCNSDATSFDAFIQLAAFGEVIYG